MKKRLAILTITICLLLAGCSGHAAGKETSGRALPILLYHHFTASPPPGILEEG